MTKPYRIKHKASGLYYQPAINHSNLSKKGKVYMTNNSLLMINDSYDYIAISVRKSTKVHDILEKEMPLKGIERSCGTEVCYRVPKSEFEKEELQRMKIRLAKKIMACDFRKVVKRNLPWDKELKELDILCKKSHYWYLRHYAYRPLKMDSRNSQRKMGKRFIPRPPYRQGDKFNQKEKMEVSNMEAGQLLVLLLSFCALALHIKNRRRKG